MNILLTGGAGFIGSVVAAQLLAAGHENVVVFDDLSKGNRCQFRKAPIWSWEMSVIAQP